MQTWFSPNWRELGTSSATACFQYSKILISWLAGCNHLVLTSDYNNYITHNIIYFVSQNKLYSFSLVISQRQKYQKMNQWETWLRLDFKTVQNFKDFWDIAWYTGNLIVGFPLRVHIINLYFCGFVCLCVLCVQKFFRPLLGKVGGYNLVCWLFSQI